MKKKFEAVSGDQSLFDLLNAEDHHILVVRSGNGIYASEINCFDRNVIAERRPVPKYIPKAGDVFAMINQKYDHGELLCLKSNDKGIAFEYLEDEKGHFDSVSTSAEFLFIRSQPVERYVPEVGDFIAIKKKDGTPAGFIEKVIVKDSCAIHTSEVGLTRYKRSYLLSDNHQFIKVK